MRINKSVLLLAGMVIADSGCYTGGGEMAATSPKNLVLLLCDLTTSIDSARTVNRVINNADKVLCSLPPNTAYAVNPLGQTPDQVYLDLSHIRGVPAVKKDITIDEPYMLLRARPDIKKAERLLAASNEDIGAAMGDWFPKVQLLGIAGRVMISAIQSSKIWTIGSLFGWPIIDFGRVRYNVCAKESAYRQALLTYEKTVINAVKEVENGLVSYITEHNTGIILTHELDIEEKRLRCTYDLFVSGLGAEQAYLINRKRVDEIKLALVDSQANCAIDFVLLSKALGGSL